MKKVLIVEDNRSHSEMLHSIVYSVEDKLIICEAATAKEAYQIAMEQTIDLFLIDIILNPLKPGDVSGLVFADRMRKHEKYEFVPIIFITSLEDPELHAYSQIHCFGYIEKPFDAAIVKNLVQQALHFPKIQTDNEYYYIRKDGVLYPKKLSDIIYIENTGRKITVVTVRDSITTSYKTCKAILEELDSDRFVQCSRSCIVNREYIKSIDYANRYIELIDNRGSLEIGTIIKNKFLREIRNV